MPKDITMLNHADIRARDWDRMHTVADRRLPFILGDGLRRRRDGLEFIVRPGEAM